MEKEKKSSILGRKKANDATRGKKGESNNPNFESLPFAQFVNDIIIPLLSELGGIYISPDLEPTDSECRLVFLQQDFDESQIIHRCLILNEPFNLSDGGYDYFRVLKNAEELRFSEVTNPLSKNVVRPDRVWLISRFPIPTDQNSRLKGLVDELCEKGIKIIDKVKLIHLIKNHLPSIYVLHCQPSESYEQLALDTVKIHDERNIFEPNAHGTIDDIYVQVDVATKNGFFHQLAGKIIKPTQLNIPKKISEADWRFLCDFCGVVKKNQGAKTKHKIGEELDVGSSILDRVAALERKYHHLRLKKKKDTDLGALKTLLIQQREFESNMHRIEDIFGNTPFQSQPSKSLRRRKFPLPYVTPKTLLALDANLAIFGPPGAGKTFQSKMLFSHAIKEKRPTVFFPCASYDIAQGDLVENIVKYWEKKHIYKNAEIRHHLAADGTLLILDGLDEAIASDNDFPKQVVNVMERYPALIVVVTCRSAFEVNLREDFLSIELEGFSIQQIDEFIAKWFVGRKQKAETLMNFLRDNEAIGQAAKSPMVASLLVVLHDHDQDLPQTYAELYRIRFEFLFERWDKGRKVKNRNIYRKADKFVLLRDLAFQTHKKNNMTFTVEEYDEAFRRVLGNVLSDAHRKPLFDELLLSNGVIVQDAPNVFSFGHLSYQEYLAAEYVHSKNRIAFLSSQITRLWWREVVHFFASITGDVTILLNQAHKRNRNLFLAHSELVMDLVRIARYTDPSITDFVQELDEFTLDVKGDEIEDLLEKIIWDSGTRADLRTELHSFGHAAISVLVQNIESSFTVKNEKRYFLSEDLSWVQKHLRLLGEFGNSAESFAPRLEELVEGLVCICNEDKKVARSIAKTIKVIRNPKLQYLEKTHDRLSSR